MKPKKSAAKKKAAVSSRVKTAAASAKRKPAAAKKPAPKKPVVASKKVVKAAPLKAAATPKSKATKAPAKAKLKVVAKPAEPAPIEAPAKPIAKKKAVRTAKVVISTAPVPETPKAVSRKPTLLKSPSVKPSTAKAEAKISKLESKAASAPGAAHAKITRLSERQPVQIPIAAPIAKPPARKAPANIPAILLEGDQSPAPIVTGPGQRYSLGPTPPVEKLESEGELPSAYGTQHLLLSARDPQWLYAHWDLTDEQQRKYNSRSSDGHLVLRIHAENLSAQPAREVHLNPESRHWFVHVDCAGTRYVAELGYYSAPRKWISITTSAPTFTPPDAMSEDSSAEFATIPFELPMAKLLSLVKEAVQENAPLAEALKEIEPQRFSEIPQAQAESIPRHELSRQIFPKQQASTRVSAKQPVPAAAPSNWTPAQERALAEIISMDHVRRVWMGSMEITELIRRQVFQELAAEAAKGLGPGGEVLPSSPTPAGAVAVSAPGAISSPTGEAKPKGKGFWFNINAELIIYGATEPDATVTIAGRKIRLRPDGSFSYRFALPDGSYELPVVAVSADQTDGRAAELSFSRETEIRGDVGVHPQDPQLKRPEAQSFE